MNLDISKRFTNLYDHFRKNDTNLNISVGAKEKFVQSFIFYESCTMNTVNEILRISSQECEQCS